MHCRHRSEGFDYDCVHVCSATGPVLGLETVVVLLLLVLMVWVGEMKIGSLAGWKGGRGRWGYPGDSSNEDRMRETKKKGEERQCPLFFPSLLPSKAGVTAEVCSLLLLFQPAGYLNPGQPSSLRPYLHRSSPSPLNSSFIFSLSIPLSRFTLFRQTH